MNQYTMHEAYLAQHLWTEAKEAVKVYASDQDHAAAVVAVLTEALILAGGAIFLKPTEE